MSHNNDQFVTTTTTSSSAMEKHVKFWDRKNKGYITPVDTVFGFINLGYGLVISITLGTFFGILCSYSTQDSWMPDVLCRTRTEKLQKGANHEPYNSIGQLDLELFEHLFSKHAKSDISGKTITIKELLEWNEATYNEPLTWSATALEWMAIYLLVGSKGVVKKEDIQAAYDGTLFYQVRDRNKHHRTMISQDASAADNNNNNLLNVSGVKVSKSYISQVSHVLPYNTVSSLETKLRHWLSFVHQQQQQQQQQPGRSILKGVPTPVPTRRALFAGANGGGDDDGDDDGMDTTYRSSPLFDGGLTGVMGINLMDQAVPLTGVQSIEEDHTSGGGGDDDDNGGGLSGLKKDDDGAMDNTTIGYGDDIQDVATFSMAGVRSENEDGNWLHAEQLTGVSPSTSATTNLVKADHEQERIDGTCEDVDFDKRPTLGDIPNGSTPPLTETSSVTSDMDGSDDTSSKGHEEEPNKTNMNVTSSKKKNKKNKKKKNKQQEPAPPAKDDDDDLPASPSDIAGHQQTTTSVNTMKTTFHHHSAWPSVADGVPTDV